MGKRYLLEHIVEQYNKEDLQEAYNSYVSELIRGTANEIGAALGGGELFTKSWNDLRTYEPETRTAEEIKNHFVNGLKNLGGNE